MVKGHKKSHRRCFEDALETGEDTKIVMEGPVRANLGGVSMRERGLNPFRAISKGKLDFCAGQCRPEQGTEREKPSCAPGGEKKGVIKSVRVQQNFWTYKWCGRESEKRNSFYDMDLSWKRET